MKTIKQIITVVALAVFMLGSFNGNANDLKNDYIFNKVYLEDSSNNPFLIFEYGEYGCATFTVGIDVGIVVTTQIEVCGFYFAGTFITTSVTFKSDFNQANSQNMLPYDISHLLKDKKTEKKLNSVELSNSSIEHIDGKKIRIKKGNYQIIKDKFIYLEFEIVK